MSPMGQPRISSLGAARPLPPSADIGPGGQSVGQAAQQLRLRLPPMTFPLGEAVQSAGPRRRCWAPSAPRSGGAGRRARARPPATAVAADVATLGVERLSGILRCHGLVVPDV